MRTPVFIINYRLINNKNMWSKNSWKNKVNAQEILYKSAQDLDIVIQTLTTFSGIVDNNDILLFSQDMEEVAKNHKFLLHIGDCAELFEDCNTKYLNFQFRLFTNASKVLENGLKKNVCCVGRIAGQYAKPRSERTEKYGSKELVNYYGDIINSYNSTKIDRLPNPNRMMLGYLYSKKTLTHLCRWELKYQRKIYISHEALLLPYEQALSRKINGVWYNLSCHFPWIGMRTAFSKSAHIEYIRGIKNPVGIKIGPNTDYNEILEMANILNPLNTLGKLIFIYRFGVSCVEQKLINLLDLVKKANLNVVLCCDPMHGNTTKNNNGMKIRDVNDIIKELKLAINIHKNFKINLGGVHLEACGNDIYECIENEDVKSQRYKTKVDPRLNYSQTMKILDTIISESNITN